MAYAILSLVLAIEKRECHEISMRIYWKKRAR